MVGPNDVMTSSAWKPEDDHSKDDDRLTNVQVGQLSKDQVSESAVSDCSSCQNKAESEINDVDIMINLKSETTDSIIPRASNPAAQAVSDSSLSSKNKQKTSI
eukprot:TRINITY_DN2577_c0_g1_i1.p1 TRINITY_DN2577_c0_g1~~TRINITY_DN2577_c0_g1_i1.p1  ORF type:complete len:103 (+),score=9.86 TRINITY_DN2577_c0_g1_i1:186-494(+)